jgi:hypothetical protein
MVSNNGSAAGAGGALADLLATYTKKAAIPPSTTTIVPSKLKIPQFIPWAIGESDWP